MVYINKFVQYLYLLPKIFYVAMKSRNIAMMTSMLIY